MKYRRSLILLLFLPFVAASGAWAFTAVDVLSPSSTPANAAPNNSSMDILPLLVLSLALLSALALVWFAVKLVSRYGLPTNPRRFFYYARVPMIIAAAIILVGLPTLLEGFSTGIRAFWDGAPLAVEVKYESIMDIHGAAMLKCQSGGRVVYHVFGSGGFVTDEYFFDGVGKLIGTFQDTDDRGPGYKGPPVSVSDCKTIRERG